MVENDEDEELGWKARVRNLGGKHSEEDERERYHRRRDVMKRKQEEGRKGEVGDR